jgi:hypothetical protein
MDVNPSELQEVICEYLSPTDRMGGMDSEATIRVLIRTAVAEAMLRGGVSPGCVGDASRSIANTIFREELLDKKKKVQGD